MMPDPSLVGNHEPCLACGGSGAGSLQRMILRPCGGPHIKQRANCSTCAGCGWVPSDAATIIEREAAAARGGHWIEFDTRNDQ